MIEKLKAIAVFARVVELGSFRAAARDLALAPSRISQTISNLEDELGVALLYRSTRRMSLTNEGRILYAKASEMVQAAEGGLDALNALTHRPAGQLRVTAPAFVIQTDLVDAIASFAKDHPDVGLTMHFSDRPRDLIRDGYDVGIRAGWLNNRHLQSQALGKADRFLVASPDYYASRPTPTHPRDLEGWDWVRFEMRKDQTELTAQDGATTTVVEASQFVVDSAESLYEFAVRGLGLTVLPENLAMRGLKSGALVRVLPDWAPKALGLHAVWPDQSRRISLTQIFVGYLAQKLQH